jgi:hypothetical protein
MKIESQKKLTECAFYLEIGPFYPLSGSRQLRDFHSEIRQNDSVSLRNRCFASASPIERGLPGSNRVEHHADAWMTIAALSIMMLCPECVLGDVHRARRERRELGADQWVIPLKP